MSITTTTLQDLFSHPYQRNSWLEMLETLLPTNRFATPLLLDNSTVSHFCQLGRIKLADGKELGVYEIKTQPETQLQRNRVQMRQLVAKECRNSDYDGALAVYYDDRERWRFSFISMEYKLDEQGQLDRSESAPKRYTYLLGEGAQIRTAVERFSKLSQQAKLQDLVDAFAVAQLNKEFYQKLFEWYEDAKTRVVFPNDLQVEEDDHKSTSLIRLLTRLLFVWFIKEKQLINADLFDEEKVRELIHWDKDGSYYKAILQNLFFATLNQEIEDRGFRTGHANSYSSNYLITNRYRYRDHFKASEEQSIIDLFARIPFLNGGLFECLDREATAEEQAQAHPRKENKAIRIDGFSDRADNALHMPNELFFNNDEINPGLIDLLAQYQFTVEESTPMDQEVALDPELLGLVFENLLASYNPETQQTARKASGSYYTPREIVNYMVDESLRAYFAQATDIASHKINRLFKVTGAENKLTEHETIAFIQAIDRIKIIDPAVGSGAFPMGILQRLVQLLGIVDSENKQWKQRQIDIVSQLDDPESREQALEDIENIFSRENRFNDFGRKLYLIQNSIFGVDIQPIACQIAKLRFFISLAIEQEADETVVNFGIKPLPNLETRFVAANTLIGVDKPVQMAMGDTEIDLKEKELSNVRKKHFSARTSRTKAKYRDLDAKIRVEISKLLEERKGFSPDDADKIANWDPYNHDTKTDWFDSEWMFGITPGFDVVIGNPPYVRADSGEEHLEMRQKIEDSKQYETLWEKWDLYIPFIERGYKLLKPGGFTTMIVSDAYCHSKYAQKSQEWFLRNSRILRLDFFSKIKIFDAAVHNVTYLFQRADGSCQKPERRVHDPEFDAVNLLPTNEQHELTYRVFFPEDTNFQQFLVPTVTLDKICYITKGMVVHAHERKAQGEFELRDLVSDTKDELHPTPFVEGKHLERWLPATNKWLEWGTRRAPDLFSRPTFPELYEVDEKILVQRSPGPDPKACYDGFRLHFTESSVGVLLWQSLSGVHNRSVKKQTRYRDERPLRPDLPQREELEKTSRRFAVKFLLGVMNAIVARDFLRANRRSNIHLYPDDWKKLPIPDVTHEQQTPIIDLVDQILTAKHADPDADVSALEAEIDQLVYELYELTPEEIGMVVRS